MDAVQRAQMQNVLLAAALRIAISECFWHSTAQYPDTSFRRGKVHWQAFFQDEKRAVRLFHSPTVPILMCTSLKPANISGYSDYRWSSCQRARSASSRTKRVLKGLALEQLRKLQGRRSRRQASRQQRRGPMPQGPLSDTLRLHHRRFKKELHAPYLV